MTRPTDVRCVGARAWLLPVQTRVPLKFGSEVLTSVTCLRVQVTVRNARGQQSSGWGEVPLSVQLVWPSALPYGDRYQALLDLSQRVTAAWVDLAERGHPLELWGEFERSRLPGLLAEANASRAGSEPIPWLAALLCCSACDLATHDAFGQLCGVSSWATLNDRYMTQDLQSLLADGDTADPQWRGRYPGEFLRARRCDRLVAWHLVGGLDPLSAVDLDGSEPRDGHPVLLEDWIARDGLKCLKVKLRGTDAAWDYGRLVQVGGVGLARGVRWLSADFNCTVTDPAYVTEILDRLLWDAPEVSAHLLYVEQPFPYELEQHAIDVRSVAARKPLFMDESAHDWRHVRLGRELGWSGVALKTCKTLSGALLSLSWAQQHGMTLMVQDLTNPALAQIPHVSLAAHARTIMGVETNSMQYYPEASAPEAAIHPGLYRRRNGEVDLSTVTGAGLGYRVREISRSLPEPAWEVGDVLS
ncbi:MAG: hypothetical protein GXY79_08065 [Chloroflexi bacterium]|nr:hypothetical protein [Chloroflexota bacterium]